eukprot:14840100-Alexandrium_andersonii.AAC.1
MRWPQVKAPPSPSCIGLRHPTQSPMSGMLSSKETVASGVPRASSDPSIKPGTVSASARRRS